MNAQHIPLTLPSSNDTTLTIYLWWITSLGQQVAFVVNVRVKLAVKLQQAADSTEIAFVFQEQGFERPLGPVVHGEGQQLHRDGVHPQEVTHEHHLVKKQGKNFQ